MWWAYYPRCVHSKIKETQSSGKVYKRSQNTDELLCFLIKEVVYECVMCGNTRSELQLDTKERCISGDISRDDLIRYNYILKSKFLLD